MAEIHIHGTGNKINLSGSPRLSVWERAIRTSLLSAAQSLMLWFASWYLAYTHLVSFRLTLAQSVVVILAVFTLGEAWRGGMTR